MSTSLELTFQNQNTKGIKITDIGIKVNDDGHTTSMGKTGLNLGQDDSVELGSVTMHDFSTATWNIAVVDSGGKLYASPWQVTMNPSQSRGPITLTFDGSHFRLVQQNRTDVPETSADVFCNF